MKLDIHCSCCAIHIVLYNHIIIYLGTNSWNLSQKIFQMLFNPKNLIGTKHDQMWWVSLLFLVLVITLVFLYLCTFRLVMYLERDSRRQTPRDGKVENNGSDCGEYLMQCLDLLINHIVDVVPKLFSKKRV